MAHCEDYIELISAAVDGALSPAEQEKLNAHLSACPECQNLYDDLLSLHAALAGLPPAEVPEGLKDRVMDAVAAEKVVPFAPKKASQKSWRRWLASAAVLAVVLMGTWSWKPWEGRSSDLSAPRSNELAVDRDYESSFTTAGAADGASPAAPASAPSSALPSTAPESVCVTFTDASAPAEKNAVRSAKEAPSPSPKVDAASQGFGASGPTVSAENGGALSAAPSSGETVYGYASVGQAPDPSAAGDVPAVQSAPAGEISPFQAPAEAPAPQSAVMPRLFSAPVPSDAGDSRSPAEISDGSVDSQPTAAPRLFSVAPILQAVPSSAGEEPPAESAPVESAPAESFPEGAVTSQAQAVNVLANYIYEFVGDVEPVENGSDGSYAINSPTGVSGVVTCVGENEEAYFLDYRDELSPDPLHYSVNKQTSEVTLLDQEELSGLS